MFNKLGLLFMLIVCSGPAALAAAPPHDRVYWDAIIQAQYAVPAGETPFALAQELSEFLGSPDPELRDRIAYSILSVWLSGDTPFTNSELRALLKEWQGNLKSDAVLKRSFSALSLAELVKRDRKSSFLEPAQYRELLTSTLEYLASERDFRGFDPVRGWVHATAHTADLLAALARHRLLTPADQKQLLAGIALRLSSAGEVFTQGEQDRLAQAVTAIVLRSDFDAAGFDGWLTGLRATTRQAARTRPLTPAVLATVQNNTYFLQALYARLSLETIDGAAAKSRAAVLDALNN
ncbi:MAG TPA: DUF2785 domain-containing protein [Thermoanaerobaculia bacterium]|jgi:hypothetical protein|nr:DUF2785 domain-containing protein [Thermoanaerobaculia bacterium]